MLSTTSKHLVEVQDDEDTVVLPNACPGALIQMDDDSARIRCFSILTKQPHAVPPEQWSLVTPPEPMPAIDGQEVASDKLLVDHVTRGVIGDNAMQLKFDEDGALRSIRLLPTGSGPAQAQWEAQAKMMLE
jgi:hypothetical protein